MSISNKRIDYLISFSLGLSAGNSKASKEKGSILKSLAPNCRVISLDDVDNRIVKNKFILMFVLEFYYFGISVFTKDKPELIFTRSYFYFGSFLVSKILKVPLIVEKHADFWEETKLHFENRKWILPFLYIYHRFTLFFIKRSDGIIFNHPHLQDHYFKNYPGIRAKGISIYNGANPLDFYPIDKNDAIKAAELDENRKYIIFLGSVCKWHGVEYVLEAFSEAKKKFPAMDQCDLLVIGSSDEEYLEMLKTNYGTRKDVFFIGKVNVDMALQYINACEYCLLPVAMIRSSPGSPLKLYDYIACGKPVLSQSDVQGYSDVVEKYGLGATCNFPDIEESSSVMHDFLRQTEESSYLENNRNAAENDLSWKNVIKQWLEFGESFLA